MKAEIKIQDCPEPYAVIYTQEITEDIHRVLHYLKEAANTVIGLAGWVSAARCCCSLDWPSDGFPLPQASRRSFYLSLANWLFRF